MKDENWKKALTVEFEKDYFKELEKKLEQEYKAGKEIFPPKELIFNAFNLTPLDKVPFLWFWLSSWSAPSAAIFF